jgi:hypothetical protein
VNILIEFDIVKTNFSFLTVLGSAGRCLQVIVPIIDNFQRRCKLCIILGVLFYFFGKGFGHFKYEICY